MFKFLENLKKAITLYALEMNPIIMDIMSVDELKAFL